jgi:hypothetical protein
MRDEDVEPLFQAAGSIGWKYNIVLLGDDSIVPMRNFKLSDIEHVIHELAHVLLWGLDVNDENVFEKMNEKTCTVSEYDQQLNEISAFSVTLEVLRRLGAGDEIDIEAFYDALMMQLHNFVPPVSARNYKLKEWLLLRLAENHKTDRGRDAVEKIVEMFHAEGV